MKNEIMETLNRMEITMRDTGDFLIALINEKREQETKKKIEKVLTAASDLHPYKIPGQPESYSTYCEAWADCIDFIRDRMTEELK